MNELITFDNANSNEREQSEFNMAFSYLNRLNAWFYMAAEAAMKLDSYGWFQALVVIFRELSTEMKDEELENKNKKIKLLNEQVVKNQILCFNTKNIMIPHELWFELHTFELGLRRVMREAGLQQKLKEQFSIEDL